MLTFIPGLRECGWDEVGEEQYREAWYRLGGSVATHPDFVRVLSSVAGAQVRYWAWVRGGATVSMIPTWGRHLALSKDGLKSRGKAGLFDLGSAEVILPTDMGAAHVHGRVPLRHKVALLSELVAPAYRGLRLQKRELGMVRAPNEHSAKFHSTYRRKLRVLHEQGGQIRPIAELTADQVSDIYEDLFRRRWGKDPVGHSVQRQVFRALHPWMAGHVIELNGAPVALQIVYRVESPNWVSLEYINGGVDPACNALSPGSLLLYANTTGEWSRAQSSGKEMRYSFGLLSDEYKKTWCRPVPIHGSWF